MRMNLKSTDQHKLGTTHVELIGGPKILKGLETDLCNCLFNSKLNSLT